jgi:hypothetical protein
MKNMIFDFDRIAQSGIKKQKSKIDLSPTYAQLS